MSDDSHDDWSAASQRTGPHSRPVRLDVLRRAMRWETFALAAVLVILALAFG